MIVRLALMIIAGAVVGAATGIVAGGKCCVQNEKPPGGVLGRRRYPNPPVACFDAGNWVLACFDP